MAKLGENPMLNSETWSQFVKMQGPAIQGLMTSYLEQSANSFVEMQQQLQQQARNMFSGFPFAPFGTTAKPNPDDPKR
jgi:polyhydroxyalkanoate synthesis regulator protein